MPQINLLSPGAGGRGCEKSGSKARGKPVVTVDLPPTEFSHVRLSVIRRSLVCIGVCAAIWAFLFVTVSKERRTIADLDKKIGSLATSPKEIDAMRQQRSALEKKINLIDTFSSRQFFWFQKMQQLDDLVPNGVWLTSLQSSQKGDTVTLVIRGTSVAVKIDDAVSLIRDFITNLRKNDDFAKDFKNIELRQGDIAKTAIGGMDVMRFAFTCETE